MEAERTVTETKKAAELHTGLLYHRCDPGSFSFETTADLKDDIEFIGQPSALEALGFGVDIEREVETGGPLHSKGVLILTGFMGERYSTHQPLSLSASLVFEQSYGGIEGDSASSAKLYALLSAIADVPVRQALAVTGSVNQHGRIQPIGGVNEKIG